MKNILVIIVFLVGLLSGCTTIHFDKGENSQPTVTTQQWHHNFALALYEGSSPVNLSQACGTGSWVSVKTELTFSNVLAGAVADFYLPIWYPKTVEVSCK